MPPSSGVSLRSVRVARAVRLQHKGPAACRTTSATKAHAILSAHAPAGPHHHHRKTVKRKRKHARRHGPLHRRMHHHAHAMRAHAHPSGRRRRKTHRALKPGYTMIRTTSISVAVRALTHQMAPTKARKLKHRKRCKTPTPHMRRHYVKGP